MYYQDFTGEGIEVNADNLNDILLDAKELLDGMRKYIQCVSCGVYEYRKAEHQCAILL